MYTDAHIRIQHKEEKLRKITTLQSNNKSILRIILTHPKLSIHPVLSQFYNNLLQFYKTQLRINLTYKREGLLLLYVEIL
jgi:hypothetical protein